LSFSLREILSIWQLEGNLVNFGSLKSTVSSVGSRDSYYLSLGDEETNKVYDLLSNFCSTQDYRSSNIPGSRLYRGSKLVPGDNWRSFAHFGHVHGQGSFSSNPGK
jgi:hypothetical protein